MGISSAGIGSGLDVNSIVSQLVAIEKQPLQQLQTKASSLQTQLTTYGQIQSQISSFSDAMAKLAASSGWDAQTASSSNASVVAVTVSGTASSTNFDVQVNQLAKAQSIVSPQVSAGSSMGAGVLHIQLGAWTTNMASFVPGSAPGVDISIEAGADSPAAVAEKINAANAGVSAMVVTDSNGQRLLVKSQQTGVENGFQLTVTDNDGNPSDSAGLSRLMFNPAAGAAVSTLAQAAQNALVVVDGVSVISSANALTEVIPGITINVSQVSAAPVSIQVKSDTAALKQNIQGFVDAYNTLNKTLSDATKYESSSKTAGPLQGDATTTGLAFSLRNLLQSSVNGGALQRLSDAGIELQRDGSLKINASRLDQALTNLSAVKGLFSRATQDQSDPARGLGWRLRDFAQGALAVDGLVSGKSGALKSAIQRNSDDQTRINDRASLVEARLKAQYTQLDATMARMNALNTYVTQQISLWSKTSSSDK